jgi:hypothetical protein
VINSSGTRTPSIDWLVGTYHQPRDCRQATASTLINIRPELGASAKDRQGEGSTGMPKSPSRCRSCWF